MRFATLFILIGFSLKGFSQIDYKILPKQKKYTQSIQVSAENGMLISNGSEKSNQLLDRSYYNGLEFKYGWTKNNTLNTYNQLYRFPTLGIGWYGSTFHNSDIGKPNALYLFFHIPVSFENDKRWTSSYTGAFGVSYDFNPYDTINNPANILIGSRINAYVHFAYNLNFKVNSRFTTFGSVGFKHFSNGATTLPNKGINLIPFALGVRYRLKDNTLVVPECKLPEFIRHNQINIMFGAGSKNYNRDGENYFKSTLGINILRQINYKYRLGGGMDFFYASAANFRNPGTESYFSKAFSCAIVGSWEWVLNRTVCVPMGVGLYLHRNEENGEAYPYYFRIGPRFRIAEHYNLGLTIKAHGGHADYFEWSFVYTIHKDPNKYQ
jgi:hypothetical protein